MCRLDLRRAMSLTTRLNLVVEDQDKVRRVLIHAVLGSQEKLSPISLHIVDEGSSTNTGSILSEKHGHRINLAPLNNQIEHLEKVLGVLLPNGAHKPHQYCTIQNHQNFSCTAGSHESPARWPGEPPRHRDRAMVSWPAFDSEANIPIFPEPGSG